MFEIVFRCGNEINRHNVGCLPVKGMLVKSSLGNYFTIIDIIFDISYGTYVCTLE